ncbi:heme oxygenase BphO [Cellvibrio zantedeschiae]|uniref:Heme oxygenase BphO n=1 Tax=Cellvibrio zantedeschiae TaxID=1237077 RepID=A0ABQ3B8X8_9GAMM|nr:biliverdin-producing heme oxygenase [Cellvibrio zantedeschiae]GGY80985.1 heme oxygenase BphO [Cellvibrio zantedeschiae]
MQSQALTPKLALTRLRAETKSRHQILDSSMPLANPNADWQDYLEHLQLLSAWLQPIENWLIHFSDGPQGPRAPDFICYTDIIRKDLANYMAPKLQPITWMQDNCAAYRWGVSYVIEGSQLGGEFLYKRLADRLKPHELFYLQAKQPGRWPAFLNCLATELTTHEHIDLACAGARDAFDALLMLLPHRE